LLPIIQQLGGDEEARKGFVKSELQFFHAQKEKSPLSQLHPDWVLEALLMENPRMVATILRYLPGEMARYVIDHFPEERLQALPSLSESFALEPSLAQVLKHLFEEQFQIPQTRSLHEGISFEMIPHLSRIELEKFFRKVGVCEMAKALSTLHEKAVSIILNRLPPSDTKDIQAFMTQLGQFTPARLRQAQTHLLAIEVEKGPPEYLLIETGFYVYSKAVLPIDEPGVLLIRRKFPKNLGFLLKRYVTKHLETNTEKMASRYREEIVNLLKEFVVGKI